MEPCRRPVAGLVSFTDLNGIEHTAEVPVVSLVGVARGGVWAVRDHGHVGSGCVSEGGGEGADIAAFT
jgi:hypothetical protein